MINPDFFDETFKYESADKISHESNLRLYVLDCSWRGSITVIAPSREAALTLMRIQANFPEKYHPDDLKELRIEDGVVVVCMGDS